MLLLLNKEHLNKRTSVDKWQGREEDNRVVTGEDNPSVKICNSILSRQRDIDTKPNLFPLYV